MSESAVVAAEQRVEAGHPSTLTDDEDDDRAPVEELEVRVDDT
jgi:hypothetical protein